MKAFGAEEHIRMPGPENKSMPAALRIGDSTVFLCDEFLDWGVRSPEWLGGTSSSMHRYVQDADHAFNRAISAGAQVTMPLENMFWGDRYGKATDPFRHEWAIATHKEDLAPKRSESEPMPISKPWATRDNPGRASSRPWTTPQVHRSPGMAIVKRDSRGTVQNSGSTLEGSDELRARAR